MRSLLQHAKLGSMGVSSRVFALCAGICALTGCIIVDGSNDTPLPPDTNPPIVDEPFQMNIETDVALDSKPGAGVGIFVEYFAGGHYRISTTCDTNTSNRACAFDIYTSVDTASNVSALFEENLEGLDTITFQQGQGVVDLHFETDFDTDAVGIDVTPGAILRVEAYLDGVSYPQYIYWFGDGVIHNGAPSNPIDLVPTKL